MGAAVAVDADDTADDVGRSDRPVIFQRGVATQHEGPRPPVTRLRAADARHTVGDRPALRTAEQNVTQRNRARVDRGDGDAVAVADGR